MRTIKCILNSIAYIILILFSRKRNYKLDSELGFILPEADEK